MTAIASPILITNSTALAELPEPIESVLARLEAPVRRRSASPVLSSLGAVCTFGLLPLWLWPQRWQAAAAEDRRDLSALASWWRRQIPAPQAQQLDVATGRLGGGAAITTFVLTTVAVGASLLLTWSFFHGLTLQRAIEITYEQHRLLHFAHAQPQALNLAKLWIAVLSVAYGLHYLAMRSHTAAIRRFLSAMDPAVQSVGLRSDSGRFTYARFSPMWIICGLLMCGGGVWWGAPFVLAGARQRQYLRRVRPQMRRNLANQLRAAMNHRPTRLATCSTPSCRAPLPPGASFCPRCGASA